ncbi:MAG: hypothetical protein ACLUKN_03215 [Bacilli bacterium]
MQSSVNSSVIEIDTSRQNTHKLQNNFETAVLLSRVIGDVESLGPKFENISESIARFHSLREISALQWRR